MSRDRAPIAGRPGSRRRRARLAFPALLVLIASGVAWGELGGVRPYTLPPNLLDYFRARYAQVDSVQSTLEATVDGPLGELRVSGRMSPRVVMGGTTPEERARVTGRAFLDQEAALLDIADPAEIRESGSGLRTEGLATVQYFRYINEMPLLGWYVMLLVEPDGVIRRASATLFPVSNDVYSASKRKTLSQEEIVRIIEDDLRSTDPKVVPRVRETRRVAHWRPPHVQWQAHGSKGGKPAFAYTLDAFTGKILSKGCDVQTLRPQTPGATVCD